MPKQPNVSLSTRAAAIRPLKPTTRHLAVLDAYAGSGTYELTAATTGISPATVRNLLIEIREHYSAETTIQAYRAALAVGDLATPRG
jgi:DNA-directed RNA polymerase specialized sigma24 family protein